MATLQPYTPTQTLEVLQLYHAGVAPEAIACALDKSTRSIISKLVREGVYRTETKPPARLKKFELIQQLAQHLNLDVEQLESLEKATHGALSLLHSSVVTTSEG